MKVDRLDHIHIYVANLSEVAKFLSDIMGTKWVGPIEVPEEGTIVAFDSSGIELVQATSLDKPVAKEVADIVEREGNRIVSLGLKVPNLDEAVADLKARGIRIKSIVGTESIKAAAVDKRDTMGIELELVEYPDRTPVAIANLNIDKLIKIPSPT